MPCAAISISYLRAADLSLSGLESRRLELTVLLRTRAHVDLPLQHAYLNLMRPVSLLCCSSRAAPPRGSAQRRDPGHHGRGFFI
jgi:hypothetical protein